MANTPDRASVTKWLVDLLKSDPNAYPVGDHGAPRADVSYPYWTVWGIPGGSVSGPAMGQSQGDASFVYQVDSVGQTREQSERLASRARDRVAGRAANGQYAAAANDPAAMRVLDRISEGTVGAPVPEGTYPNEVWTTSERFVVSVSLT